MADPIPGRFYYNPEEAVALREIEEKVDGLLMERDEKNRWYSTGRRY
jgi:hypothetical protein